MNRMNEFTETENSNCEAQAFILLHLLAAAAKQRYPQGHHTL